MYRSAFLVACGLYAATFVTMYAAGFFRHRCPACASLLTTWSEGVKVWPGDTNLDPTDIREFEGLFCHSCGAMSERPAEWRLVPTATARLPRGQNAARFTFAPNARQHIAISAADALNEVVFSGRLSAKDRELLVRAMELTLHHQYMYKVEEENPLRVILYNDAFYMMEADATVFNKGSRWPLDHLYAVGTHLAQQALQAKYPGVAFEFEGGDNLNSAHTAITRANKSVRATA
ncbi:MAG TPA: hypothetical protein VGB97_00915 [Candidatus Paceibacterota bacterium]